MSNGSGLISTVSSCWHTLGRLELITQITGHDSLAAAARVLYHGRDGALRQQITKIETAAGFTIIDRSSRPLRLTAAGREFISEAFQILQIAQEQADGRVGQPTDDRDP